MRAFISVNFPENVKKEIKKMQDFLPEFIGKKTEYENLHLTLKFLGEIDKEKIEQVRKRLSRIKINKFEALIDEIGVFSPAFIKIIWLHLKNCEKLQQEVDKVLEGLLEKEKRFMSHLTIARVKKIKDKNKFLDELSGINMPKKGFIIDRFYLMKSELNPKGPVYSILDEFSLI